jgi:hypothetical protein
MIVTGCKVKSALIAGGNWNNGTNASSRYRNANNYQWNANTNIGSQFTSEIENLIYLNLTALLHEVVKYTKEGFDMVSTFVESHIKAKINMKRHGNLFKSIATKENIYHAYLKARRGRGWQDTIKDFEKDLDSNIMNILESLLNKTYTTSDYEIFQIHEPKTRDIYKLPFNPDRIVQHALMNVIEPIWDKLLIDDTYACRTGKGIHAGSTRTMEFIRKVGRQGYCLKMDISKFYPSLNHDILFDIIKKKIKCKDTLWLLEDIIYSIPEGYNVPIGNYTSQWFGNLYMNELDQHLKHDMKIKYYIRYCDDFLLFHKDKTFLNQMKQHIEQYLLEKLDLTLSKADIFPISHGVDFLGYKHFHDYILLRKNTAKRFKKRVKEVRYLYETGQLDKESYRSSLASIMGALKWCNGKHLSESLKLEEQWDDLNAS